MKKFSKFTEEDKRIVIDMYCTLGYTIPEILKIVIL